MNNKVKLITFLLCALLSISTFYLIFLKDSKDIEKKCPNYSNYKKVVLFLALDLVMNQNLWVVVKI